MALNVLGLAGKIYPMSQHVKDKVKGLDLDSKRAASIFQRRQGGSQQAGTFRNRSHGLVASKIGQRRSRSKGIGHARRQRFHRFWFRVRLAHRRGQDLKNRSIGRPRHFRNGGRGGRRRSKLIKKVDNAGRWFGWFSRSLGRCFLCHVDHSDAVHHKVLIIRRVHRARNNLMCVAAKVIPNPCPVDRELDGPAKAQPDKTAGVLRGEPKFNSQ